MMTPQLSLSVRFESTCTPAVLEFEETIPYDILLQVRRGATDLTRPLNILTDESLFDIPYAFANGLLTLISLDKDGENRVKFGPDCVDFPPGIHASPRIITLPPRTSPLPLFGYDLVIPLQLHEIKRTFVAGHRYRLELGNLDLGVKWWNYGDMADRERHVSSDSLPPSEPARLVASKPAHRDFGVIDRLPRPPTISIKMSLSSDVVLRSKIHLANLRVTIINKGKHAITLRSSGDQSFLRSTVGAENTLNHHRITSTDPPPSIRNFSITNLSTGIEMVAEPTSTCSLTVGSGAYSRKGLTTLEPDKPLVVEFMLFDNVHVLVKAMVDGGKFRLRLRPSDVWWFPGTLDDIFGDQQTVKAMPGPCLPLNLGSNDDIDFSIEN